MFFFPLSMTVISTVLANKSEASAIFESLYHPARAVPHAAIPPICIKILKIEAIIKYILVLGVPAFCCNTGFNVMAYCCSQIIKDCLVNYVPYCLQYTFQTLSSIF